MNISENIPNENGKKKMKRFLLDKIGVREIGISEKKKQIKTTAKKSFLFFCSSLTVAMGALCPVATCVYAEAVGPLPEGFNDIDLSDILITFPTGAGAGISNEAVLNDLYNNYGVSGWGVSDMTPYFDIVVKATGESAGLSNSVLNEHLGDNQWFDQNGYDVKVNYSQFKEKLDATETLTQYGANFIHQATLSPSTGNPWEWDWSSILEEYFRTGLIGFEHFFIDFDTLNTIAVTMDDVLQNVYDFWTPNISNGLSINTQIDTSQIPAGGSYAYYVATTYQRKFYIDSDLLSFAFLQPNGKYLLDFINLSNEAKTVHYVDNYNNGYTQNVDLQIPAGIGEDRGIGVSSSYSIYGFIKEDYANFNSIKASITDGSYTEVEKYSPDLINTRGNISVEDFPNMSPSIEQGQAIRPIPQQAYENWAMTNNLQEPAENGALMGALVTPYIQAEPAPAPSPAPDDPWADPVPDTEPANRPVSPEQPDFPEEPELTDEEINESLQGATPDLTEIFPFCIPWDIARILKHFTASRRAPYIEWTFESDLFGFSYTFELDMAIFDDVATILRILELAGFILGLAILTRYLIGAN